MSAFAHVGGHTLVAITVHVPGVGPWWADLELEGAPDLSGSVRIGIGELELVGTVDAQHDGTFGLQRRCRVVGGGGGWGKLLAPRHYHNDAQVRARTVAEDAAREAGETLAGLTATIGTPGPPAWAPAAERIGVDYVRQAGPASRVLEDVIGDVPWWVAYDGSTCVASRAESSPASGSYQVLEVVPESRLVMLGLDDPRAVVIGSVLSERLDAPQTVRELEIEVTGESVRVKAWCGGEEGARGRLAGALCRVVQRVTEARIERLCLYRVVRMSSDRVELQPVRRDGDLPTALPISMWPGVAGAHAELTPGTHVLVQFVDGDRRFPVITHFAGKDGNSWTPSTVVFSASSAIKLGSSDAADGVALSSKTNDLIDDLAAALDALCAALPLVNDGGAALQTAVKAVWPGGVVPTAPADVGSSKVLAE